MLSDWKVIKIWGKSCMEHVTCKQDLINRKSILVHDPEGRSFCSVCKQEPPQEIVDAALLGGIYPL